MIYTIDRETWYRVEDAVDHDQLDFIIHYADDQDDMGLEFKTPEDLSYFVLKYIL